MLAAATFVVAGAWALAGCSSLTLPLPCDLMIVALPPDSTLQEGDPLPAEPQVIAGPGDFDAIGSSIRTDPGEGVSLDLRLRGAAIERFAGHTAAHVGEPMAIVINGEVVAVPFIQSPIPAGEMSVIPATDDSEAFSDRFAGCVR
jgi:preprotein translocase subunit SecD